MSLGVTVANDILTCPYCGSHDAEAVRLDDFYLNASGLGGLTVNAVCHDCVKFFTAHYDLNCTFRESWLF